jgi:hypothetical protein
MTSNTQIHDRWLSGRGTDSSIKSGGVRLLYEHTISHLGLQHRFIVCNITYLRVLFHCSCVLDVMYLCVRGVDFASFYDFDILFWHTSDSVFISLYKKALKHTCKPIDVMNKCSRSKRCTTTITLCMRNSDMLMFILVSLLTVCTLDCFYIAWHILSSWSKMA